jgi:hypothetical protein
MSPPRMQMPAKRKSNGLNKGSEQRTWRQAELKLLRTDSESFRVHQFFGAAYLS